MPIVSSQVAAVPQVDRREEVNFFSRRFGLTAKRIEEFVAFYNADFELYDNHVYEHIESRIAHWWNFLRHDWFATRIDNYLNYLEALLNDSASRVLLVDIGFSVPYVYSRSQLANNDRMVSLFVDKERSAKRFQAALQDLLRVQPKDRALVADIELPHDRGRICAVLEELIKQHAPTEIVVVASEVVEHLDNPNLFWSLLSKLTLPRSVKMSVYVTLPIGQKIPSHTMEFLTATDAMAYLAQHLNPEQDWLLRAPKGPSSPYLRECVCVLGTLKR